MILMDTHCHLYEDPLARDPEAVLARAAARDVSNVIVPSYDKHSWSATASLATHWGVSTAYGLHPWVAHTVDPADLPAVIAGHLDACPGAVAIGEIGLDTKLDAGPDLPTQLAALRPQLELAFDRKLPVILHCRGAYGELLAELKRFGGTLGGVLHAWSSGPELAERFVAAGLSLGLCGVVTRPNARRVRRAARQLPLESFLLETDAPFIGLDGVRPADTEPGHVADVAAALAELRGEPLTTIAEVTTAHAQRLFGLPS